MDYSFRDHFLKKEYVQAIDEAMEALKEVKAFDAIHVIGLSLVALGKVQEAVEWLSISLAWPKAHSGWFVNAAMAMKDSRNSESALVFLERGLTQYPNNTDLLCARGLCMAVLGRWEDAIRSFDAALRIDPAYNVAATKGLCLSMLGRHDEAIALWSSAKPSPEIICAWASLLITQVKHDEALALLENNRFDPEPALITYNKSFLHLGMGNWPLGWEMYRARASMNDNGTPLFPKFKFPFARSLDDIHDKHLMLFSEQGLGDSVMFMRFAASLQPLVSELTLLVPQPLVRLTQCMKLNGSFTVQEDVTMVGPDIIMPMMDSPAFLGTTEATIPPPGQIMIPPEVMDKRRLPDTGKLRVGLVWAGNIPENPLFQEIAQRRMMSFETMKPLLEHKHTDRITFVGLQMPDHRVLDVRLLQPLRNDFDMLDTAAIIQQLDLVISIDSVVAHLAGTLGKPVWMLSRYDGEWRWFWDGREDSPWYPTMRVYRQESADSWPEVIGRVAADLVLFR